MDNILDVRHNICCTLTNATGLDRPVVEDVDVVVGVGVRR